MQFLYKTKLVVRNCLKYNKHIKVDKNLAKQSKFYINLEYFNEI